MFKTVIHIVYHVNCHVPEVEMPHTEW